MHIVLDTTILARATPGRDSPAREVLLRVIQPPHLLVMSSFLLSELARVLRYERLRRIHKLDDERINHFLYHLHSNALVVSLPLVTDHVVPTDPDDDPIIATAVLGQADILCTTDTDFHHADVLAFCAQKDIRIMNDVELLQTLRSL